MLRARPVVLVGVAAVERRHQRVHGGVAGLGRVYLVGRAAAVGRALAGEEDDGQQAGGGQDVPGAPHGLPEMAERFPYLQS